MYVGGGGGVRGENWLIGSDLFPSSVPLVVS